MTALLPDLLAQRAALSGAAPALHEVINGETLTYAQLNQRAGQAAQLLADMGVGAGDRVAIMCRNRIAFFELLFACAKLGAILVPLNWRMPAAELAPLIADCQPAVLIAGAEDAAVASQLAVPLLLLDEPGPWRERLAAVPHPGRMGWPPDAPWVLLYTSGTTGMPKAVIQTYGMAVANLVNTQQGVGLRGTDATLNFLPLFHTAGINLHTLPLLLMGGRVHVLPAFEPSAVLNLIAQGALDVFFGVPAVYQLLSLDPGFAAADLSRVRHWGCGGAPLPDALAALYAARGVTVCGGMGMTETGPTVFLADAACARSKPGSVGKPQLLSRVRIVGADGSDVAPGEVGELLFAGPNVTPGYWQRPDATAAAFTAEGWLRSGDLGRCDADGDYYIAGRAKEMFISGAENVYPAEVENALALHPAILEAAVVGRADQRWGEVGHAYLLLRPGHTVPDDAVLIAFLRNRLAAYKIPKCFIWMPEFPRTAAGKVQKHLLEPVDSAA
jgi:fatty-acyl-CoA synthase